MQNTDMLPILLIHGFGGTAFQYTPITKFLEKKGFTKFYEFTYSKKWGDVPLVKVSNQLSEYVRKNIKEKRFNIIGISQGGLIARHFIQNSQYVIPKCLTICTPHNGTKLGFLSKKEGFCDLRPGSDFIQSLCKKVKTKFYCIYSPLDLVVIPGWSGKMDKAQNKMILSPAHQLTWWIKPTLKYISEKLA